MGLLFSAQGWGKLARQAKLAVQSYHRQFPLRRGLPKEELKAKLKVPTRFFAPALEQLLEEGALIEAGPAVHLPGHRVQPTLQQQAAIDVFLERLERNPYSPPTEPLPDPDLLNLLIEQRRVVKVSDDVVFAASAYDRMVEDIVAHIRSRGKITVAEVRDLFHTSRKYALALMEYLDSQKLTRRIGDERVLK